MKAAEPLLPGVEMAADAYAAIEGADAAVLMTEWNEFRALDLGRIRARMTGPILVDLRNVYDPAEVEPHAVTYTSIGRG